jgi:hypothetical protein
MATRMRDQEDFSDLEQRFMEACKEREIYRLVVEEKAKFLAVNEEAQHNVHELRLAQFLPACAIPQSDDTDLTTVQLKTKFIQLKKFLTIKQTLKPGNQEKIESLKDAVTKLQQDLTQQQVVTQTVTEKNIKITKEFENLSKRLAETELTLSSIQQVLTPEMRTKLQLEQLHKEYKEEHKQKPSQ